MSSLSNHFQIHLHAEPRPGQIANESMMVITFELLAERLQKFERLHFEMDGSFVWTGVESINEDQHWQIDGMIYDQRQQIQRIELKGQCPYLEWRKLLTVTDYPRQSLIAYDLISRRLVTIQSLESTLWSSPSA
jgi:hypothetical protein